MSPPELSAFKQQLKHVVFEGQGPAVLAYSVIEKVYRLVPILNLQDI